MELTVNGRHRSVDAPPDTPLLWVLRDDLDDAGPKYGCGLEQCGACHVLVDGRSVPSCRLPVVDVAGREVTTAAGLTAEPVVRALLARNAGQCGYCLPGMVPTLVALARQGTRLSRTEVAAALDDHLCRCGAQPRILRAALDVLGDG